MRLARGGEVTESVGDQAEDAFFRPLVEGDVLSASPRQRLTVRIAAALSLAGLGKAAWLIARSGQGVAASAAWTTLFLVLALEFADFGSGVYHWAMDNYGNAETPIFGPQIEAFQGHHEKPWTITHRDFSNNCERTCLATLPFILAFDLLPCSPYLLVFGVVASGFIAVSQELHKWSHTMRSQCHPLVNRLQDLGLFVARRTHLSHHRVPFGDNYCIVSGHMNPVLDGLGFFRALERVVERLSGVRPRCATGQRFDYLLGRDGRAGRT